MKRQRLLYTGLSLLINILLSWFLLPLVLFQSRGYPFSRLLEVLLWQVVCAIGWPFALLGIVLSIPFGARISNATSILFILIYPAIQILFIHSAISKTYRRFEYILMHLLVALSFVVVWYYVLNGYDFMFG